MGTKRRAAREKVFVLLLSGILALGGGDPLATRALAEELAPEPAAVSVEAAPEVTAEVQAEPAPEATLPVETDPEPVEEPAEPEAPAEEGTPGQPQAPPADGDDPDSADTAATAATAAQQPQTQQAQQPQTQQAQQPQTQQAQQPSGQPQTAVQRVAATAAPDIVEDASSMPEAAALNTVAPRRAAAANTMTVYYGFREIKPVNSTSGRPAVGTKLLFAPSSVSTVSTSEAFLGLPAGCGMMKVDSYNGNSNTQGTVIAHVAHPDNAQKTINTSVGFDGCNGAYCYYGNDNTLWHYWCDGGGVKNAAFRIYTYNEATVDKSALTARTTTKKEVSSTDIKIPKNELEVKLTVNGTVFNIDSSRWTFVDDTVNYVKNDRQITIQFGNVQASCNVEFYGSEPDPHAYKSVTRDADKTGNLKVGETLHYDVKVTNEASTGSIWKNVTITDVLPLGLELVPGSVKLARTKTIDPADQIPSIPLAEAKYNYNAATRTITLEIPYYVLNSQAYDLTYDLKVDATSIAGGTAGGKNETRNLTNTVDVTGFDSDGREYPCKPTACLPIPGETDPDNVKVEQVVPGSENDPDPGHTETDPIAYLEHTKDAQNMTDTRPGAVTQVYDVIKYTMTMENTAAGSVFRDAAFVDRMPEGLEIVLGDAEHPMSISKASAIDNDDYWTDSWNVTVADDSYDAATRTLTATCGDMFYGEKVTLTFYAQVTPDALGRDIGNTGTIAAATPQVDPETGEPRIDPETGNPVTEPKEDDRPEPTYPEPEKDKPQETEVEKPVIDPETGKPKVDPETGEPITETVTETTGGVAAGDPEPKVEKTIEVVSKKDGVEVTDANRGTPQVGDTVRTTVVVTNDKEGTEWVNVTVNDSCNTALELIPDSIHVFDPEGNDVTEEVLRLDPETQKIRLDIPAVTGGASYTLQYDALVTGDAVSDDSADQPNITDPVEVSGETPDPTDTTPADAKDEPTNLARPGDPLDSVTKTMKVVDAATEGTVSLGDTVRYTIVAGNLGDATTSALKPLVLDPLPEGVELTSPYVYVTKMAFNRRTMEWEKASPAYVRKIARSNVYNESARTLVVPVGEVLPSGPDRVCKGQTAYEIVFECEVTSLAFAGAENLGNIAYSESEKPSEQPAPKPADPDEPDYPVDEDGDIVKPVVDPETGEPKIDPETGEPETEKVLDPENKPIKPGDTKEDHPSIPEDVDIDDYIQNPTDRDGNPLTPPSDDPTKPMGAEPVRDPDRPVYPVDEDGDIVKPVVDPVTGDPVVDPGTGEPVYEKVLDPDGNPIRNTDTEKDHPGIPDLDEYLQKEQEADPLPRPYPTDEDGDVVRPVVDPETGDPVIDPETGDPVYEKVLDADDNPVKPDETEKLEDLDVPPLTALHQVIKEVAKLTEDGTGVAGKVTYDSGKTGADRVSTENDTSYAAGDKINATVKVKNLVKGTRWSGATVIDKPSNLTVTYYELRDPYGNLLSSKGVKDEYMTSVLVKAEASRQVQPKMRLMAVRRAPRAATTGSVARLNFDGNQFRLSAAEIVGLEQYQVYYEGFVPEGTPDGTLEDMAEPPASSNPLEEREEQKGGPEVPDGAPTNPKAPDPEEPDPEEPDDPSGPTDPAGPTDPEDPSDPVDPADPGTGDPSDPAPTPAPSDTAGRWTSSAPASQPLPATGSAVRPADGTLLPATGDPAVVLGTALPAAAVAVSAATALVAGRRRRR